MGTLDSSQLSEGHVYPGVHVGNLFVTLCDTGMHFSTTRFERLKGTEFRKETLEGIEGILSS